MSDLKHRIESILFSAGKQITLEELSRLTKERDPAKIKEAIEELKKDLENKEGSIMLVEEGDSWKLTVREKYLPFVRKVVSKTELPKTVIETLAIVAFKAPVLQSKVIHIRTNKAYKHLDYLEEKGYITREKKGRTKLIKLTQKFFEYFDVPPDKLKEKFQGFEELDKAIEEVETPEVDLVDSEGNEVKLEEYDTSKEVKTYDETPSPVEKYVDEVDGLETYGEKKEHKKKHKKKEKKKEKKKKSEKEIEPPSEEELTAALTGEELPEEVEEETEKAEEVVEKVAEVTEEAEEKVEEVKEEVEEKEEEKKEEKPKKKEKKEKKKKPKKKKKEEKKEEEPEEKRISAAEIRKKAKERASEMEESKTEYKAEGLLKEDVPESVQEKIDRRAQEIVYGEKKEIEEEKKEEIEAEEKPQIEEEKKEELPKPEE